jgi:xylan 1,4-beta-xylosidase
VPKKTIKSLIVFIFLSITAVIGALQFDVVREFFSSASGVPADLVVNTRGILGPLPRPWRNLAQGGEDFAWRMDKVSSQVKTLNPEYIRLDHIYDFYGIVQGSPGNLTFDFSKFDLILDDILATGAKPYVALSYMPPVISESDIIGKPKNWADWQLTIQKTIEHVSGTRKISDVYYEVWNEPDLFGDWKYYGNKNYLDLYTYAALGANNARNVLPFKIGGPAITALYKNWFDALLKHADKNNLRLDFFSWHRYDNDLTQYKKDMVNAQNWLEKHPRFSPTLELHITEWGHDSENNAGYDNRYSAAHTVAGAISMMSVVQKAFVFEIQDGKDPQNQALWGRWGLFSHQDFNSRPKPRFYALQMLEKLGNQRLEILGEGSHVKAAAAVSDQGNTQVIMANFDRKNQNRESVPLTFTNISPGEYSVQLKYLSGKLEQQNIATDSAAIKTFVPIEPNDVVYVELVPASP